MIRMKIPLFKISGNSDTGKTTILSDLIHGLKERDYCVGVVKHDPSNHWQWEVEDTDTDRHRKAGADAVAILSPGRYGVYQKRNGELDLSSLVEKFNPEPDIVLLEGFQSLDLPGLTLEDGEALDQEGNSYDLDETNLILNRIEEQISATEQEHKSVSRLWVDGKEVPLTRFPQSALKGVLEGFIQSLDGVDAGDTIRVETEAEH